MTLQKLFSRPKLRLFASAILLAVSLTGCELLPGQGPTAMDIALIEKVQEDPATLLKEFAIIQLNAEIVHTIGHIPSRSISAAFGRRISGLVGRKLEIGDQLNINIWESSADGLFSTSGRKQTQLKAEVGQSGNIFIPYIGQLQVRGSSVEQVRSNITLGLVGKAVDPQVQVIITSQNAHKLSIVGDVVKSGRFDVPVNGLKLIDAVALAGGSKLASYETELKVVRGRKSATVRLDDVVQFPKNNIWLKSRDIIQVSHKPRSFSTFGAVKTPKQQKFQTQTISLAEALAQTGGLNDNLADAGGVFLFRFESKARLKNIDAAIPNVHYNSGIPTIYRLNFTHPQAFFIASSLMIKDKDIIYVATAPAVEFKKFVSNIVSPIMGATVSAKSLLNL